MTQVPADLKDDLSCDLSGLSKQDWCQRLDAMGDRHGYFEKLGGSHSVLFIDAGPRLLVTFETRESIARHPQNQPRGLDLVAQHGWSLLALVSDGDTWFREPAVYGYFDRLIDDGFFEDFDRVGFFGAGSAGYAAAAFCVAAPGAQVLALRPQATLDPAVAGWDRRFIADRRRDFTTRYGFAPDMIEAAQAGFVAYDPAHALDAMHAALFRRSNVTALPCPLSGARTDQMLDAMQVSAAMIAALMDGSLSRLAFARLWRARRASVPYLRMLLKKAETAGRPGLAARVCRHGVTTRDQAYFAAKLSDLGQPLPQPQSQPRPHAAAE
ncbi:MAG: hypothetical protein GW886_09455 [Rhodobacterales bacterium]|nr:hypothetical protein [Rhodobacterales bacterium]NCT13512.1 hypothetical protein [Rhodobacterales bacterium]